jgi:hypothetical protein
MGALPFLQPGLLFKRERSKLAAHSMKTPALFLLAVLSLSVFSQAEDSIGDRLRHALDKTKEKVAQIGDAVQSKSRTWYKQAAENLHLTSADYVARADKTLARFNAEIAALQEIAAGPGQRDYFKTRVLSLQQHATFAKGELETLRGSETEELFRARQKSFDRTMWTLENAVGDAQEEAGL